MAYKEELRLKGVPFSGFKGKSVISVKGMQRSPCRIQTLGGGGGPVIQPLRYGGGPVPPKKFSALRASVWSKNKGGPSPGSATGSKLGI